MPTHYEIGRQAEYRARDRMKEDGFVVFRMSGSHGVVDLIGVSDKFCKFVQVKATTEPNPSYTTELAQLREFKVPPGDIVELWVWIIPRRVWVMMPV